MIGNILYSFFVILSFALSYGLICLISNKEEKAEMSKLIPITFVSAVFTAIIYTVIVSSIQGKTAFGLSSLGGAIGYVGSLFVCNKIKPIKNFGTILHRFIYVLPLIYGISKIGCYFRGCCGGYHSEFSLQLVEACLFILLFFIGLYSIPNILVMLCSFLKFGLEFLRNPNTGVLNANQITCIVILAISIGVSIYKLSQKRKELKMREKNTLTFLIGPCLSGKSHYCEKMKSEDCIIVSSDAKRLELGITTDDPSTHECVFTECKKDICKALKNGKDVIFDATNLNSRLRRRNITFYRNRFPNVIIKGIVFDVSRDTLHSRASSRKPTDVNFVSHDMIDKQFDRLHWNYPTADDFDEFDILKGVEQQSLKNQIEETLKMKYEVDRDETNFGNSLNDNNISRTGDSDQLDR